MSLVPYRPPFFVLLASISLGLNSVSAAVDPGEILSDATVDPTVLDTVHTHGSVHDKQETVNSVKTGVASGASVSTIDTVENAAPSNKYTDDMPMGNHMENRMAGVIDDMKNDREKSSNTGMQGMNRMNNGGMNRMNNGGGMNMMDGMSMKGSGGMNGGMNNMNGGMNMNGMDGMNGGMVMYMDGLRSSFLTLRDNSAMPLNFLFVGATLDSNLKIFAAMVVTFFLSMVTEYVVCLKKRKMMNIMNIMRGGGGEITVAANGSPTRPGSGNGNDAPLLAGGVTRGMRLKLGFV